VKSLLVISHSYASELNRKSLVPLCEYFNVRVVIPDRLLNARFGHKLSEHNKEVSDVAVCAMKALVVISSQYIFPFNKLIREMKKADIVLIEYDPWSMISLQIMLIRLLFKVHIKLIFSVKKNTLTLKGLKFFIKKFFITCAERSNSYFIFASEMSANVYRDLLNRGDNILGTCIHMGVDTEIFNNQSLKINTQKRVCFVGQLRSRKGIHELLSALTQVNATFGRVELKLIGDGPLYNYCINFAKQVDWLEVVGGVVQTDVGLHLQNCDIFVYPIRNEMDHQEHDAHSVMEAMCTGLPVVSSRSGILPELLGPDVLFCNENDSVSIARLIILLFSNEQKMIEQRNISTINAKRFSNSAVADEKAKLLMAVCGESDE
jgi:glycosyltransferase involved in cell wall biosynthesis